VRPEIPADGAGDADGLPSRRGRAVVTAVPNPARSTESKRHTRTRANLDARRPTPIMLAQAARG